MFYDVKHWDAYHLENDPPKLKELYEQGALFIGAFDASEQLAGISVVSNQTITDYPDAKLLQYFLRRCRSTRQRYWCKADASGKRIY